MELLIPDGDIIFWFFFGPLSVLFGFLLFFVYRFTTTRFGLSRYQKKMMKWMLAIIYVICLLILVYIFTVLPFLLIKSPVYK